MSLWVIMIDFFFPNIFYANKFGKKFKKKFRAKKIYFEFLTIHTASDLINARTPPGLQIDI